MSSFPWPGWGCGGGCWVLGAGDGCEAMSGAAGGGVRPQMGRTPKRFRCVARVRRHRVAQCSSVSPHERARLLLLIRARRAAGRGQVGGAKPGVRKSGERTGVAPRAWWEHGEVEVHHVRARCKPPALEMSET